MASGLSHVHVPVPVCVVPVVELYGFGKTHPLRWRNERLVFPSNDFAIACLGRERSRLEPDVVQVSLA